MEVETVKKPGAGQASLCVELKVTQAQLEGAEMDRSDSRAVLVPVGAVKSEEIEGEPREESNPHRGGRRLPHLPCLHGQAEAPERASTGETPRAVRCDPFRNWKGWSTREFLYLAGPALLMSVAYLDPGNLEADIQMGANAGMVLLWFVALCFIAGYMFQCMTARLGVVTGRNLAALCGLEYSLPVRVLLWLIVEVGMVGADIQETVGSAIAIYLLSNGKIPLWAGCLIISVAAFAVLLLERLGARHLEAVFGGLIGLMAVSMGVNYVRAGVPQGEVFLGLVWPRMPRSAVSLAVGALGALVMPHNIYFHSAIVNARNVDRSTEQRKRLLLTYCHVESAFVLTMAFCINLFVICLVATAFYGAPHAEDLGLETVGYMLEEKFGKQYRYVWALGLLASGLSSTIVLTYCGQIVMAGFLNFKVKGWARMTGTRLLALVPAVTIAVVFEANQKFDDLNQLLNIVQSLVLPFALIPLIYIAGKKEVMGSGFTTSRPIFCLASLLAMSVLAINGYQLVTFMTADLPQTPVTFALFPVAMAVYYGFAVYLLIGPPNWSYLFRMIRDRTLVTRTKMLERINSLGDSLKGTRWADPASVMEVHI